MSGKFMSVKRIIIPTITMVIIASQLMGCAAASQNELLQMINQGGDAIEIEVAVPLNQEEGTAEAITWEQLALLESNETLREGWDDLLGISITDTGKNGMLYVDVNGDNVNNNTLRMALHNREFAKLFEDENSMLELSNAAQTQYADIEADETEKAVYMGINGYFNLLPDATPNYSNPDSTLNRLEFMSMVMRAETPVSEIAPDSIFATAVGTNDLNIYAQEVADNSYLDLASKSLNNMTANGTITRGEAVYLLMSRYFADELAAVDISKANLSDAKDGGDLIEKAQSQSKEDITEKDYLKSYVLTYVITNPDQGVPTDLYKALVLAESKGIIDSETHFDEGITKAEAVEMLIETLMQETGIASFNCKQGTVEGYTAETEEPAEVLTGEEISLDIDEEDKPIEEEPSEDTRFTNTEVSPFAGTTSKHGYVFHDDYIEGGPKDEDAIADIEMMFDKGWISEEEYQELIAHWSKPREERIKELTGQIQESTGGTTSNDTTVPGTGGDTVTVTVQPAPTYEFDGHYSY